jgi:hypothetical protein
MEHNPMLENTDVLKCEMTPEQTAKFKAAWTEYNREPWQSMPLDSVPDDPAQQQVELLVANLPVDSTGLLIVKVRGDAIPYDTYFQTHIALRKAIADAGLALKVLTVPETSGESFDFQLLTNEQLRDIGFERAEPRPDFLNITRDVV